MDRKGSMLCIEKVTLFLKEFDNPTVLCGYVLMVVLSI